MKKAAFTGDRDRVIDALDIAVKGYGPKVMAYDLGKGESTLRNELNINLQEQYKLGLLTAIAITERTGDFAALDMVEEGFGRVAFFMPADVDPGKVGPVMKVAGKLTREFGESMTEFAKAIADGRVDRTEARRCLKELRDVIKACVELKAYMKRLAE